jgi:hypothetical protein
MYFIIIFYYVYCKGMKSQSQMQLQILFVWFMKMNRSGDGLIENPKLVTRRFEGLIIYRPLKWTQVRVTSFSYFKWFLI